MKPSDFTKKIDRFGNALEKMLVEEFPDNEDLRVEIERHLTGITCSVINAFIERK